MAEELTKQEQIREGFAIHLYNRFEFGKEGVLWRNAPETARQYFLQVAGASLRHLDKRGAVIKVAVSEGHLFKLTTPKELELAGFTAWEPLIKERDGN